MTEETLDTSASEEQGTEELTTEDQVIDDTSPDATDTSTEDSTADGTIENEDQSVSSEDVAKDGDTDSGDGKAKQEDAGYWPEDWREAYADGDEKVLKRLARYASPQAAIDAMISAQDRIASGKMTKPLTDKSTPEEIAEYRELHGIPESPAEYNIELSEGLVAGDEDTELLKEFLTHAHESNYSQDQVNTALEWYFTEKEMAIQDRYEADVSFKSSAEDELRLEWGPEYQANRNLMANYLSSDFGPGVGELIVQARLPDGNMLSNHPDILRGFVAKARAANPMGALAPGTGTKQMDSVVSEIKELESKMGTSEWYSDKAAQERYLKLVDARDRARG